jgi:hypothetical protein
MKPLRAWMWKADTPAPYYGIYTLKDDATRGPRRPRGGEHRLVRVEVREVPDKKKE